MPPKTFAFVDHSDTREVALRSIRSHVTRQQHEKRRRQAHRLKRPRTDETSVSSSSTSSSSTPSSSSTEESKKVPDYYNEYLEQQKAQHSLSSTRASAKRKPPSLEEQQQQYGRPRLDLNTLGPFALEPVPKKDWYGWLTNYWYGSTMPRSAKLLKTTPARIEEYTIWSRRLEMTEPALYYMSLLLASGIPVANGSFPLGRALWLRGKTIQSINEALSDPQRATSVALIVAVGQMALHEHIYGDREACHRSHRPAQQQMIALRGGIERLGLPAIVIQIMVWYDKLMASEASNVAYFADLPRRMKEIQEYDEQEAQDVTNYSSPRRHRHPGYHAADGVDTGFAEEMDDCD